MIESDHMMSENNKTKSEAMAQNKKSKHRGK